MIEWHLEIKKIKDLQDFAKNPRQMTKRQFETLKKSISKYGLIDKPIVNLDNTIIGGHQRIRLLKKMGKKEIEVQVPSHLLDQNELEELNILHNQTASWDDDILANQYELDFLIECGFEPDYFGLTKEKPTKGKIKVIYEFENHDHLDECLSQIDKCASEWKAKLTLKLPKVEA